MMVKHKRFDFVKYNVRKLKKIQKEVKTKRQLKKESQSSNASSSETDKFQPEGDSPQNADDP